MNGFLLDTSVLSLLAPNRSPSSSATARWLRDNGERLFVSTITIAEIEQGIRKLRRMGGEARANLLADWLAAVVESGRDRILPFTVEAAMVAGALSDASLAKGRHPGFADIAIAATAKSKDLTLLTTNGRHFEPLEIDYLDPSAGDFVSRSVRDRP